MSEAFDRLAKRMAQGGSRRDVLKALGGFLAGGFLFGLVGKGRAHDHHHHHHHDHDNQNQQEEADITATCQSYCQSCNGLTGGVYDKCLRMCQHQMRKHRNGILCGTCTATSPFNYCIGGAACCITATENYCANFNTDVNNCGACGQTCTTGDIPACCYGVCVDLASDPNHCGGCRIVCSELKGPGSTCVGGMCT